MPPVESVLADIAAKEAALASRYVQTSRHTIQVDYIAHMDELAAMIGCAPRMRWLTDFALARKLAFGPNVSYVYRLEGAHKFAGAREAVMKAQERVDHSLKNRETGQGQYGLNGIWATLWDWAWALVTLAVLVGVWLVA